MLQTKKNCRGHYHITKSSSITRPTNSPPNTASKDLTLAQQPTVKQSPNTRPHISQDFPGPRWCSCTSLKPQIPEIASPYPYQTLVKQSSFSRPGTHIPKISFPGNLCSSTSLEPTVTPTLGFVTRLTHKRLNHRRHSRKVHKRIPKPKTVQPRGPTKRLTYKTPKTYCLSATIT